MLRSSKIQAIASVKLRDSGQGCAKKENGSLISQSDSVFLADERSLWNERPLHLCTAQTETPNSIPIFFSPQARPCRSFLPESARLFPSCSPFLTRRQARTPIWRLLKQIMIKIRDQPLQRSKINSLSAANSAISSPAAVRHTYLPSWDVIFKIKFENNFENAATSNLQWSLPLMRLRVPR